MNITKTIGVALTILVIGVAGLLVGSHSVKAPQSGGLSSPDISSSYLSWGGVTEWHYRTAMNTTTATTTICSFPTPPATSTLQFATAIGPGATTTYQIEWGYAANTGATTTSLGKYTQTTAGNNISLVASSTATDNGIVTPNNFINLKIGGIGGANVAAGICEVGFRQIAY